MAAPTETAGTKVYCPGCYVLLTIPETSTISLTEQPEVYQVDAKPIDVRELQDRKTLSLRCSVCHTNVSVTRSQAGTIVECPECQTKIPVPASFAEISETSVAEKKDKEVYELWSLWKKNTTPDNEQLLPFHCKLCGTLIYAPKSDAGTEYLCPDCGTKTVVPMRSIRKSATADKIAVKDFEGTNTFAVAENQNVPKSTEPLVPVICSLCHTRMYALESEIGGVKVCPDCGTETEIKFVPKEKRILPDINEEYAVAENAQPAPRPVFRTQTDYRYVKGSIDKAVRPDRYGDDERSDLSRTIHTKRISLPKYPFLSRFYKPLLNAEIVLHILVASLFLDGGVLLYIFSPGIDAYASFLSSVLFGFLLFFCGLLYISQAAQSIFLYSAAGVTKPTQEDFSNFVPTEAAATVFWLLMLLILAATPGHFAGEFFFPQSDSPDSPFRFLLMAFTAALIFPIFYLSCAETNSYFEMLAKGTLSSLISRPFAWIRFYFFSLLLLGIPFSLLLVIEQFLGSVLLLLVAGPFLAAGIVLYFCLLGCLGFVLSFGLSRGR
jgi:DNA-directed RNA polymerase subunit M/transcription elongation factor TFIIS